MNARILFSILVVLLFSGQLCGHPLSQSYWFLEVTDSHLKSTLVVPLEDAIEICGLSDIEPDSLLRELELLQQAMGPHFELVLFPGALRLEESEKLRITEDQIILEGSLPLRREVERLRLGSTLPQQATHEHEIYCTVTTSGGSESVALSRAVPVRDVIIEDRRTLSFGLVSQALPSSPAIVLLLVVLFAGISLRAFPLALVTLLISTWMGLFIAWFWLPDFALFLFPLLISWIAFEHLVVGARPLPILLASGLSGLLIAFALQSNLGNRQDVIAFWVGFGVVTSLIALISSVLGHLFLSKRAFRAPFFLVTFVTALCFFVWNLIS